jgi:hypothetical protein
VNRRLLTILIPLTAVSLASCSTLESDAVATVDGTEMSQGDLDELLAVIPNASRAPGDPDNANDARQTISIWIQGQLISGALDRYDVDVPTAMIDEATQNLATQLPGFTELSDANREVLITFVTGEAAIAQDPPPVTQELLDLYALGPEESGLICVSHILTADVATAVDVKSRLDDGADFIEIATSESIDPGSGQVGGDLGCFELESFGATFIPEFVDGALAAEVGQPTDPVESQFGTHIILVRTAEESVDGLAALGWNPRFSVENADISVASRYGTFDLAAGGVIPLG